MKPIPLIKRLLLYIALLPIGLIVSYFSMILMILISGNRETGMGYSVPVTFLITHYVFGIIFLKTKLIVKIIVPFVTALVSGIIFWLMFKYEFFIQTNLDMYRYFDVLIQMALTITCTWEIAYQILKIKNSNNSNEVYM